MTENINEEPRVIFEQTLENKLTHIHLDPKYNQHFFIGIYVKTGSLFERPKEAGISHYLEHMLFRGSKKNPSFLGLAEKFERYGGEWNAATGHEHTEYTYMGLNEAAPDLIELFSEIFQEPLFLEPEKEKEIILREIEDELNEFGEFVDIDFHSSRLAWNESGFQFPITGDQKSVSSLTPQILRKYFETHYKPENIVICTWGGDEKEKICSAVRKNFNYTTKNSLQLVNQTKSFLFLKEGPLYSFIKNTDNQLQVQLSFYCDAEWSEKTKHYTLICHLLTNGFSSRLSKRLREDYGLVYSIGAHLSSYQDRGLLSITYATTPENFESALKELLLALKDLKENGIYDSELERSKKQELLELLSLVQSPESYCFYLARNKHWNQSKDLKECITECESIKKNELEKEISQLFCVQKSLIVIMGSEEKTLKKQSLDLILKYLR